MANILIVDDEKGLRRSLAIAIETWGHQTREAGGGEEALPLVSSEGFDVVLTDLVMEPMDGIALLNRIKSISPSTEVILMSAFGTIPQAVEAMKRGASDFIIKPFSNDRLKIVLDHTLDRMALKRTVKHLKTALVQHYPFTDIVADSPGMQAVMERIRRVANWSAPVLVQGESGVGKELAALAIHHIGERRNAPFVAVNCGAFPETLLDSELFGHAKGAFTGAAVNRRGFIEEADGGTLFLDEIGEASSMFQVRLLRFLDNGLFRRVGETHERRSDVRIIAATNRDLKTAMTEGRFREDLFYRLTVTVLAIPPLRERPEDIGPLIRHFLTTYAKRMGRPAARFHPDALSALVGHSWPGNVRELENTIEHALIVAPNDEIHLEDLGLPVRSSSSVPIQTHASPVTLDEIERNHVLAVLGGVNGNKKKAAELLGISRTTLLSRLKAWKV
jgi:DNA-binding NtrC family response regulator